MKKIASLLVLCVATLTVSCSSDSDGGSSTSEELFMKFKVNGVQYNYGDNDVQTIQSLSTDIFVLGDDADDFRNLNLYVPNDKTEGSHTITYDPSNVAAYQASYGTDQLDVDALTGTINITNIDAEFIEGTFSFSGLESTTGDPYTITEGSFRAYNITD
jgi:hypothetical protein